MVQIREKVEVAISKIRPYLEADGGDIELVEVTEELIVHVRLLGACRSCEMSAMTLRAGVEETIRRDVPEVKGVVALREVNV